MEIMVFTWANSSQCKCETFEDAGVDLCKGSTLGADALRKGSRIGTNSWIMYENRHRWAGTGC